MELTKGQQAVYDAILENPRAVDDDALLIATIWNKNWLDGRSLYENIKFNMRPESISRRRRELKDMGLISYSKQADKDRYKAYNNEVEEHHAVSWL